VWAQEAGRAPHVRRARQSTLRGVDQHSWWWWWWWWWWQMYDQIRGLRECVAKVRQMLSPTRATQPRLRPAYAVEAISDGARYHVLVMPVAKVPVGAAQGQRGAGVGSGPTITVYGFAPADRDRVMHKFAGFGDIEGTHDVAAVSIRPGGGGVRRLWASDSGCVVCTQSTASTATGCAASHPLPMNHHRPVSCRPSLSACLCWY
jgi:hypothetical protein